jgi:iron(III) transport system substrate-binding protein
MKIQLRVSFTAITFLFYVHAVGAEQVVVVYRSIKDVLTRSVAERFEKETGIPVRLVPEDRQAEGTEPSDCLVGQKNRPCADVFWADDPVSAVVLKSKGLAASYESPNAKNLSRLYSDPEHHWTGFPARAVVILYNKNLLSDPDVVPTSVLDMMNPRFSGKACVANPLLGIASIYAAALFEVFGTDFAEAFFNSLKTNKVAMLSSISEVRRRVAAGEFVFGLADTDDFYTAVKEGESVGALLPDQKSFGTLVIPNALVLLANAPNPEQGKQFIDFLLRPEIQKLLATSDASQMPIGAETSVREAIPSLNSIKSMEVDYGKLVSESKELSQGFLKEWIKKEK